MWIRLCLILVILNGFFFWNISDTWAEDKWSAEKTKEQEWLQLALQIQKQIGQQNVVEAKSTVTKLAISFSKTNFQMKKYSLRVISALSNTILEMDEQLNQALIDPEGLAARARKLVYSFDVLVHTNQPLWHNAEPELQRSVGGMKQSNQEQKHEDLREAVRQFQKSFDLVRPAILISKSPSILQRVDSMLAFLEKNRNFSENETIIQLLEQLIPNIFHGSDQDVMRLLKPTVQMPMPMVIIWLISTILIVLSYFLWKKYEGTKARTE
ncbi:sporulation protein YpjB [Thermoactinomyces sp. DSM 45892]|uniref:sporulation protein YpjB n=1 Tax=Thermoactinomyces sp. DSM 45892 TaxID=1882753 RepID=UPI00089AD182|nr:sporulation protein YpjB [Thermoactinomyces sp. DSM 45892]SDY98085.1 sporulation protein YpjB [Thermoactinomyces sp. DSM 45892]